MKKALLTRVQSDQKQSLGYLFGFDGTKKIFESVTLELDQQRNERRESRIIAGTYLCTIRKSDKYGLHYLVNNTPNRDMILIHVLNYNHQTEGCIGIGQSFADINKDGYLDITASRKTLDEFLKLMGESFYLTIVDLDY